MYENSEYDVNYVSYSQKRKVLTSASYTSWKRERFFFDDESKAKFEFLEKELDGYEVAITDGVNTSLLYRETEADEWATILTTNFKESFNPHFFTFDNKNLIGSSNIGRDKSAIVVDKTEPKKSKKSSIHSF